MRGKISTNIISNICIIIEQEKKNERENDILFENPQTQTSSSNNTKMYPQKRFKHICSVQYAQSVGI